MKVEGRAGGGHTLELGLGAPDAAALVDELRTALAPGGAELALTLPQGWVIYWKHRPAGGSRMQVARPQLGEWVASLQLGSAHAEALVARLVAWSESEPGLAVSTLGGLSGVINFELVLRGRS